MPMLELVQDRPDWMSALGVALTRPPGVEERRTGDDRGRRRTPTVRAASRTISRGCGKPSTSRRPPGFRSVGDTAAVAAWQTDAEATQRLDRLRTRRVLDAAGFLLHDEI
jgi:hypothetical protein